MSGVLYRTIVRLFLSVACASVVGQELGINSVLHCVHPPTTNDDGGRYSAEDNWWDTELDVVRDTVVAIIIVRRTCPLSEAATGSWIINMSGSAVDRIESGKVRVLDSARNTWAIKGRDEGIFDSTLVLLSPSSPWCPAAGFRLVS